MEDLSGAASGIAIAIASLTIQIVESISKFHDFFESMKMASKEVTLITKDLAQLMSILDCIKTDEKRSNDVLTTCMDKIKVLNAIIGGIEPGIQSSSMGCI